MSNLPEVLIGVVEKSIVSNGNKGEIWQLSEDKTAYLYKHKRITIEQAKSDMKNKYLQPLINTDNYVMGHDPYKNTDWPTEISKVAKYFEPNKYDRFSWKITDFEPNATVVADCNLESNNQIILDRDWYTPGYYLLIKNYTGSGFVVYVESKKPLKDNTTLYNIVDVNNIGGWIYAGAKVVADYIDPDTESINK